MKEEFLFCVQYEIKYQTNLIGGKTKIMAFKGEYHLFHKDTFGPTISLCKKIRSDIGEQTKIMNTMPHGVNICEECKYQYMKTPLFQKWVKSALPDTNR